MGTAGDASLFALRARERDRARRAVARSSALGNRLAEAHRRQQRLVECAFELRHACRVARARRQYHSGGVPAVGRFAVDGLLDGRAVSAAWRDGGLACDDDLRARALLLVDLEEEFVCDDPPRVFIATLEGPPIAVALTLIRACDRVTRIVLAPPEAA